MSSSTSGLGTLPLIRRFSGSDELYTVLDAELAALRAVAAADTAEAREEKRAEELTKELAKCYKDIKEAREKEKEREKAQRAKPADAAAADEAKLKAEEKVTALVLAAKAKTLLLDAADTAAEEAMKAAIAARGTLADDGQRASETLSRLYRRQTIKLHPDKNGEETRAEFESLVSSAKVLRDLPLRHAYLTQMSDVMDKDPSLIPMADIAWFDRNAPGASERAAHSGKQEDGPGRLTEGGTGQMPKAPRLGKREEGSLPSSTVRSWVEEPWMHLQPVSFLLPPQPHSYARLNASYQLIDVGLEADDGQRGRSVVEKQTSVPITDEDWQRGHVDALLVLPGWGDFDVRWSMENFETIAEDGSAMRSPWSMPTHIFHTDPRVKLWADERTMATGNLVRTRAALESALRIATAALDRAAGTAAFGKEALELAHKLHLVQVRAVGADVKLTNMLAGCEGTPSALRPSLAEKEDLLRLVREGREAGRRAALISGLLEPWVSRAKKVDDSRRFYLFIARKLEVGEFSEWVLNRGAGGPSEEALALQGGSVNRLYQLVVEGFTAGSSANAQALEVDAFALHCAAQRADLFSAKQLKKLEASKTEIERAEREAEAEQRRAEARAIVQAATRERERVQAAEALKVQHEQRKTDEARGRVYGSGITLGGAVRLHGLSSALEKNNQLAVCTSVDDEFARKGRVVVRMAKGVDSSGRPKPSPDVTDELSVRIENVLVLDDEDLGLVVKQPRSSFVKPATVGASRAAAASHSAAGGKATGSVTISGYPRNAKEQRKMTRCCFFASPEGCANENCMYAHDHDAPRKPPPIVKAGAAPLFSKISAKPAAVNVPSAAAARSGFTVPAPVPPPVQPASQWVQETDASSGTSYYWHRETRETTWTVPPELLAAAAGAHGDWFSDGAGRMTAVSDANACVICFERTKSHCFSQCFHKCVCAVCADAIVAGPSYQRLCPICRTPGDVRQVYE